jgi:nucleotide-binding universal stress UspA family protein
MTKRILVPLGRDVSSEQIVPVVRALASGGGGIVRLLRVTPVPDDVVGRDWKTADVDQQMEHLVARGRRDLRPVETQLTGIPVESVVRFGDRLEEILLEAEAFEADLVALTAPARSGLRRLLRPGIAEQVTRALPTGTLVLHV